MNMIENIINTVDAYLTINMDVLDTKQKADLKAQIAYLKELNNDGTIKKDVRVSRRDFIDRWNAAYTLLGHYMDTNEERFNFIYGYPVEVHWNGMYCDCSDGAVAYNNIIEGVKGVIEEEGDDEYNS